MQITEAHKIEEEMESNVSLGLTFVLQAQISLGTVIWDLMMPLTIIAEMPEIKLRLTSICLVTIKKQCGV